MEEVKEEMAVVHWPEIGLQGKTMVLKELLAVDDRFLRSSKILRDVGYGGLYFTEDAEKLGFKGFESREKAGEVLFRSTGKEPFLV